MGLLINIEERRPIWIALSALYLDTELQKADFNFIALKIIESPYSFEEVKRINEQEVFPILKLNLLSVAGEWAGFEEDWLVKRIKNSLNRRNLVRKLANRVSYVALKSMQKASCKALENSYSQLNNRPIS